MSKDKLNTAQTILKMQKLYKDIIKAFWKGYNKLKENYEYTGDILSMPVIVDGVDIEFIFNGRKYTVNTADSLPTSPGCLYFEETMEKRAVDCFLKTESKLCNFMKRGNNE